MMSWRFDSSAHFSSKSNRHHGTACDGCDGRDGVFAILFHNGRETQIGHVADLFDHPPAHFLACALIWESCQLATFSLKALLRSPVSVRDANLHLSEFCTHAEFLEARLKTASQSRQRH